MKIETWMKKKSLSVVTGAAAVGIAAGALANASVLENLFEPGKFQKFEKQDAGEDYDYVSGDGENLDLADADSSSTDTQGAENQQYLNQTDTWSKLQNSEDGSAQGLGLADLSQGNDTGNINGNAIQFTDDPVNTSAGITNGGGILKTNTAGNDLTGNGSGNGTGGGSILKPDSDTKSDNSKNEDNKNNNGGSGGNEDPTDPSEPKESWEDTQEKPQDPYVSEDGQLIGLTAVITKDHYVLKERFQDGDATVTATYRRTDGTKITKELSYGGENGYQVMLATDKTGTQTATFYYKGMSTQTKYYVNPRYVSVYYHASFEEDSDYYIARFPGTPLKEQEGYEDVAKLVAAPQTYAGEGDLVDLTAVHAKMIAFLGEEQIASAFSDYVGENYKDVNFLQEKDGYLTTMLGGFGYVFNKKLQEKKTYVYYPAKDWSESMRNVVDLVVNVPEGYKIRRTVTDAGGLKDCVGQQVLEGYEGDSDTLTVPMGVTQISLKSASSQVTTIEIPQSVQKADFASIAENLPNLKAYTVADESMAGGNYLIKDGVVYSKDGKTLLSVPAGLKSFEVPAGVTALGENCFAGSDKDTRIRFAGSTVPKIAAKTGLKGTVTVPDSEGDRVRKAYMFAFGEENEQAVFVTPEHKDADYLYMETENGPELRDREDTGILMGIPAETAGYYETDASVTTIGFYAFYGCENVTDIQLGTSVTSLQENSLVLEKDVESIHIKNSQVTVDPHVFGDGSCLKHLNVYVDEEDYPYYIYTWTKILDPVYGDQTAENLLRIQTATYVYRDGVKYRELEQKDGEITYRLVKVYENRTEINVMENTTEIAAGAFVGCNSMEVLNLPATLEKVPSGMLKTCASLEIITRESEKADLSDAQMPEKTGVYTAGKDFRGFLREENCVYGENLSGGYTLLDVMTDATGSFSVKAQTTAIGKRAFAGCQNLSDIWVEEAAAIQTIGAEAFRNCGMENTVDLTAFTNLQSIGAYAFADCVSLPELLLPDQLSELPEGICYGCDKLERIVGNGVRKIRSDAFWGCNWLRYVEGMEKLTELGDRVFYGCSCLRIFTMPETMIKMGESCFANCTSLAKVEVNGTITGISRYCFYGCSALTDIQFVGKTKETIQVIGVQAFAGCEQLESLDLRELSGLTRLGERTFASCGELTTVRLPANLQNLPNYCMENCGNLSIVQMTGEKIPELGEKIFGETLSPFVHLWIGENQVDACQNAYREMLDQAYGEGTTDQIIEETNEKVEYVRGVEFEWTDEGRVLKKAAKELSGSYVVPENTVAIEADAFRECQNLTQVEIPAGAKLRLGDRCFKGCKGLKTVYIDAEITEWGEETFMDCTGITAVQIGAATTSPQYHIDKIGDRAFMNCTGLSDAAAVSIRTLASVWGKECFAGCYNLTNVAMTPSVPVELTEIQDRAFYGCTKLRAMLTSKFSGLKTIGAYAFSECDTLKQPAVPAGVTFIGEGCFMNCDNVQYVSFYGALEEYPKYCFKNCPKLIRTGGTAAAFNGLKRIGEEAYEGCSSLVNSTSWNLGRYSNLQEIGDRAFAGCASLGDSTLQATIRKIGREAFSGCTQMHTLNILAVTPPTIGTWTRGNLAADLIIRVPDSEENGDSIYMAYLDVLKQSMGEKDAYNMLDSVSDGAMERNKPETVDETEEGTESGENGETDGTSEGAETETSGSEETTGSDNSSSNSGSKSDAEEKTTGNTETTSAITGDDSAGSSAENGSKKPEPASDQQTAPVAQAEETEKTETVQESAAAGESNGAE